MPSPFPGMDPYLEGSVWPDVHHDLATRIKDQLVPQLVPDYVVRVSTYTVIDDNPSDDIGILYPDIDILHKHVKEPEQAYGLKPPLTPATTVVESYEPIEVPIPRIDVRDRENNRLVTAIEIISPVNKRNPGLQPYLRKRAGLLRRGVNLLEIDLLRRGRRTYSHASLPTSHYLVVLSRQHPRRTDCWAIGIKDTLPIVPIPLRPTDPDARLDIGDALTQVYEHSRYDVGINYSVDPPPPAFLEEELEWMKGLW